MPGQKTPRVSNRQSPPPTPATDGRKRIFLVDDHPVVRNGLAMLIGSEPDLTVCGQGEDAFGALRSIRAANPDLCLVDISLKDSDGIELVKEIKAQFPEMLVLVVSMHDEAMYAERALRSGARGYVMKQEPPQAIVDAIRRVLGGQVVVSERINRLLLQQMVGGKRSAEALPMDRLTDRELEIFRMIGAGDSAKEIADKLCLSVKTVQTHREHIKEKLGLKSSSELLRFAVQNGPDAHA